MNNIKFIVMVLIALIGISLVRVYDHSYSAQTEMQCSATGYVIVEIPDHRVIIKCENLEKE